MFSNYSGIYKNLSNEDYHNDPAISRSGLIMFRDSPKKYWANYINPNRPKKEITKAMNFGIAFHVFILQPELFDNNYTYFIGDKRKKSVKEKYEKLMEIEKIILHFDEIKLLENMKIALEDNLEAISLVKGAIYEQSYFWKDKETGLWLKSRPDILHNNMIVDLKSCISASYKSFYYAMKDGGYDIQGALAREAINILENKDIPNIINICCEKYYPFDIGIKIIGENTLNNAKIEIKNILIKIKECFDNDFWPGYLPETIDL